MSELFKHRNILYNFTTGPVSPVNNSLKSLRYLGPKIWNIVSPDIRNSGNSGIYEEN